MKARRVWAFGAAAASGACAALLLDPSAGRRRRALLADKLAHYRATLPRRARGSVRGLAGPMRGQTVALRRRFAGQAPEPPDTDMFITQRVASELGRKADLPLASVTFETIDGVVRLRGTVPDQESADRLLQRVARTQGVRAAKSLLRLPTGAPIEAFAGDQEALRRAPRAVAQAEALRERLLHRWPALTDEAIQASDGHPDRLAALISDRTGEPAAAVRRELDELIESRPSAALARD